MTNTSYIRGLIGKDQYQETTVNDWERVRGEELRSGEARPLTEFEIHFLKCCKHQAEPFCPKEIALLAETTTNPVEDDVCDTSDDNCDSLYSIADEDYSYDWEDLLQHDLKNQTPEERIQRYAADRAIALRDLNLLEHMLNNGTPTDITLSSGNPPLLHAAEHHDYDLAALFVKYDAWPFGSAYGRPAPLKIAMRDTGLESSNAIIQHAVAIKISERAQLIADGHGDQYEEEKLYGNSVLALAVNCRSLSLVQAALEAEFDCFGEFDPTREESVIYPEMDCEDKPDRLIFLSLKHKSFDIARLLIETRKKRLAHPDSRTSMLDSEELCNLSLRIEHDVQRLKQAEEQERTLQARRKERELDPYRPLRKPTPVIDLDDDVPF